MEGSYWIFSVLPRAALDSAPVNNEIQFERRYKTSTSCNSLIFHDF